MVHTHITMLIAFSISVSGASNVPVLSESALFEGISDIPHLVFFYKKHKIPKIDRNGRLVDLRK